MKKVILATPTTFIALLKAWLTMAARAGDQKRAGSQQLGKELYERFSIVLEAFREDGRCDAKGSRILQRRASGRWRPA